MDRNKKHLPPYWFSKSFGEIFEFLPTLTLSRSDLNSDESVSGIYNIHYGDIHSTYNYTILDFDTDKKIPKIVDKNLDETKLTFLKDGDLVIADASEDYEGVGTCIELQNIGNRKVTAGLHTFAAREKSNQLANGFKGYLFKHPWVRNELKKLATGSKVYGVSKTNIAELGLVIPPLSEQQKIASILSKWDETIEAQTQLIEAKEKHKKGLMQKLLTGEVRFPGFEGEWETKSLNEILTIGGGRDYKHLGKGDIPVYGTGGYMTSVDKFLIDGETVCIGRKGTIDVPRYFNGKIWTVDTLFYCHSFKQSDAKFIFYLFQSINWKDYNEASGVPSLSKSTIGAIEVSVPLFDEQIKIASILNCIDEEIKSLTTELNAMKLQKKGLMQELLTGRIRVKL